MLIAIITGLSMGVLSRKGSGLGGGQFATNKGVSCAAAGQLSGFQLSTRLATLPSFDHYLIQA